MKLFIKLTLLPVVADLAGPFIIKGPDRKALMNLDRVRVPAISLPDVAKAAVAVKASVNETDETPAKSPPVPPMRSILGSIDTADVKCESQQENG